MSANSSRRQRVRSTAALCSLWLAGLLAATPSTAAPTAAPTVKNSALDAPLFYQLLLGEMELRSGAPGTAYQVMLDAARRTKDEVLFRRAVEIAVQARAGEQALQAASAWRTAMPQSSEALRYQAQLLMALNRVAEAMEPIGALLQATPQAERSALISELPRYLQRASDRAQAASLLEHLLQPHLQRAETRTASRVALARAWQTADQPTRALELLQQAQRDEPGVPGAALAALELSSAHPAAEQLVLDYLKQPQAEAAVRLAYVRTLTGAQRYGEAAEHTEALTRQKPDLPQPWLTLGALRLELRQPAEAEQALQRFVQLAQAARDGTTPAPTAAAALPADDDNDDDEPTPAAPGATEASKAAERSLVQGWLLLAQAAEMRGDYKAAEAWLAKVDSPQRALEVQARRAALLARQGKLNEARELLRKVPERSPEDARAKLLAEAQMLRELKRWREANQVFVQLNQRFPDEPDLLYEQAMVEEKLDRLAEMERLLRRVIELKPDHHHAYNALGYSLADRKLRLQEAKALIDKAIELAPGDPFITDSLGWVHFRLGNRAEALSLLRKAYTARPDTEIAAHLAEVLWVDGQQEEARKVLREAKRRDSTNEVLKEVIARLKVDL